jgi:phosphoserine aminotransferase
MASEKPSYGRGINFGAGPAALPIVVLEKIKEDLMNFRNSGSIFHVNIQGEV